MNQPDSIQKSRPGLRREALPGSLLCLGFRSPDGQLETARESGGRPGRSVPDGRHGPPRFSSQGWEGGTEVSAGAAPAPPTSSLFYPHLFLPSSANPGRSRDLGRRPAGPWR